MSSRGGHVNPIQAKQSHVPSNGGAKDGAVSQEGEPACLTENDSGPAAGRDKNWRERDA